jgi:membrane protein DedA with SNARE-associated domain
MNKIAEITNGALSAILMAIGYAVLWCGIFCLIGYKVGANFADKAGGLQSCAMGCLMFSVIIIGSGIAWYYIVKPKA